MMRRTLRGLAAAALSLSLLLFGTATPVKAADNANYWPYISLLMSAFDKGRDGLTPTEAAALIQEIVGAVDGSKVDLLDRLDSQVTNELKGKAEAALTKVELLRVPWLAGAAINSMHDAAFAAKAHIATVSGNDAALDTVGRAMIALFTELNTAYVTVDADEGTNIAPGPRRYFRQGLEQLIQAMTPSCEYTGMPNAGVISYVCEYDGRTVRAVYMATTNTYTVDGGAPLSGRIDAAFVHDFLMAGTARELAKRALEVLVREGVTLP
ncbi:hypothetical protein GCM10022251_44330 [Phytohabitans flavus]